MSRLVLVAVACVALALVLSGPASARTLPLPAGHRSTEANVAVHPTDPNDVLVVARDEDHSQLVGLRMWRSRDGGRTFRGRILVDRRLGGLPAFASDPVALFDRRGRPSPAFLALRYGPASWDTRIVFGSRTVVRAGYGPPLPDIPPGYIRRRWYDKPWPAIDPVDGLAHVTWTQIGSTGTGPVSKVFVASARPGRRFRRPHLLGDGSGSQPVVGRGSTVEVVWFETPNLGIRARILSARSRDRGRTWSAPRVVARGINARGDPPYPSVVRSGSGFVACWQQYATWPRERVACSRSRDGVRWSRPRVVAQPRGAGDAAQPALATASDGRLWLAFYRFDRRSTSVELWSSRCGTDRWQRRGVLMRRPVPRSGTDFLGDYQGLAATRRWVIAAFVMPVRPHAFRQVVEVARFSARG